MSGAWTLVVVIIALLVQPQAWARTACVMAMDGGIEHALAHWQGESHHHHDDGSYHADDSEESAAHAALDAGSGASFAADKPVNCAVVPVGIVPAAWQARAGPGPFLEGPLRPPRLSF
jgi:hypothetical protein